LIASIETLERESKLKYQVAINELYSHLEIPEIIISITTIETKEYEASILLMKLFMKQIRQVFKQSIN
jgi:hypothetical protein